MAAQVVMTSLHQIKKKRKLTEKEDFQPNIIICKKICNTLIMQVYERFSTHLTII